MKEYNWGIIGLGHIAEKFASDLLHTKGARLYGVASRSKEKAQKFAKKFNATLFFDDYLSLIKCKKVDIIYIATPHTFHFEQTMLCLEEKKAVLCEKPITLNSIQLELLIDKAKSKNVFLMEALWTRFLPGIENVLSLIADNEIGKILSLKADFGFKAPYDPMSRVYNPELGGGSLLDVGIYPLFLAQLILGKPTDIIASANLTEFGIDKSCKIILKYNHGKSAELYSAIDQDTAIEANIYGENGRIRINKRWHEANSFTLYLKNRKQETYSFENKGYGYSYEAIEVMRCIDNNKIESELWSLNHSLQLMNTMDSIRNICGIKYPSE